jgi:hypothetical protein
MCEPVSIAAGIAIVVGAAVTAYGQHQQGQAAKKVGEYNKSVAEVNAELANRAARDAEARGKVEGQRQQTLTEGAIARARAAAAARGVDALSGSALAVQEDIGAAGKQDELTTRRNARREALGFYAQANDFTSRGQLAQFEGASAARAATTQAAGTLISSAGGVASKWYQRAA